MTEPAEQFWVGNANAKSDPEVDRLVRLHDDQRARTPRRGASSFATPSRSNSSEVDRLMTEYEKRRGR